MALFFDRIDSPEKAYILGYIVSDGHVSKKNAVSFTICKSDDDVLRKIKHCLNAEHPIREKPSSKGRYVEFHFNSAPICNRLREMGLNNRKSYGFDFKKLLSYIPMQYERDFIRGLFDGDGSICI